MDIPIFINEIIAAAKPSAKIKSVTAFTKIYQQNSDFVHDETFIYYGLLTIGKDGSAVVNFNGSGDIQILEGITQPLPFDNLLPVNVIFTGYRIQIA